MKIQVATLDDMTIYSPSAEIVMDAPVTTGAIVKYTLMGEWYVELPFTLAEEVRFRRGSYILYKGQRFEIMSEVNPEFDTKSGGYKYTLQFHAQQNRAKDHVCFWRGGDNPEAIFAPTTDIASFGTLIVENMNMAFDSAWAFGGVVGEGVAEGMKKVSFDGDSCWGAMNAVAEAFDTEWWTIDIDGATHLYFGKLESGAAEEFRRGDVISQIPARRGDDAEYATRVYAYGSTRNLTADYGQAPQGGATNHMSEIRLRLPDGMQYIDARANLAPADIVEKIAIFDDIYPKNTDVVTGVYTIERPLDDGEGTFTAYAVQSAPTPFLPSDIIEGAEFGITFTSGDLNGWSFEVGLVDNNNDPIDPATWQPEDGFNKRFEIIAITETSGDAVQIIPNANMRPRNTDTFILTGVRLPQQRIDEAEQELLEEARKYVDKHSRDTTVYDCPTNPVYCTLHNKNYDAGQAVLLIGTQFGENGRLSRIQGYEKKLYNEYIATYTVGDNAAYSRIGKAEADAKAALYSQRIGVTAANTGVYLISRHDTTIPSDTNVFSALRARWEALSRQYDDTAKGRITLEKGAQFGKSYVSGITGTGGEIDAQGNAELESLALRRFLEVPELRYNRTQISVGNSWNTPAAGIIESAVPDTDTDGNVLMTGTITLHLEDGEYGAVAVDDICMGIFHDAVNAANNAAEDMDDGLGNFLFAGFFTCYFRITEILDGVHNRTFRYALRPVSEAWSYAHHPCAAMHFAGYGNFSDRSRQSSRYTTRTYERYLTGVNTWTFGDVNIAAQFGDLSNLSLFGRNMEGYSAYMNNLYMSGTIEQFENLALRMEIDTEGDQFLAYGESTHVVCSVFRGWEDKTPEITRWSVVRDSGDSADDAVWALKDKVKNFAGEIDICFTASENDLGSNYNTTSTVFTFTAELSEGETATYQLEI